MCSLRGTLRTAAGMRPMLHGPATYCQCVSAMRAPCTRRGRLWRMSRPTTAVHRGLRCVRLRLSPGSPHAGIQVRRETVACRFFCRSVERAGRAPITRCCLAGYPPGAAAGTLTPTRSRLRPGRGDRASRGANHRCANARWVTSHARHASAGGTSLEGSRKECSWRLCRQRDSCRATHRHSRRRHDHGCDSGLRGQRGSACRRPCCRGMGRRAYTSAGTTSMKDFRCSPWFWSNRKFRPIPGT